LWSTSFHSIWVSKKGLFFEGSKEVASKISTKDNIITIKKEGKNREQSFTKIGSCPCVATG
jgi:hypothetical protein